jgi:hypothetical protein
MKRESVLETRSISKMTRVDPVTESEIKKYAEGKSWTESMAIYQLILIALKRVEKNG